MIVSQPDIREIPFDHAPETAADGQVTGEAVHHALGFRGASSTTRTVGIDDDDQPATER
ncbi:hypothetical protein [Streptomyces chartreusis]|uniref:hypothetical protein n=1 Tax=Streptomyces chartreusis TaxID=1969 RepID=UPI00367DE9DC